MVVKFANVCDVCDDSSNNLLARPTKEQTLRICILCWTNGCRLMQVAGTHQRIDYHRNLSELCIDGALAIKECAYI